MDEGIELPQLYLISRMLAQIRASELVTLGTPIIGVIHQETTWIVSLPVDHAATRLARQLRLPVLIGRWPSLSRYRKPYQSLCFDLGELLPPLKVLYTTNQERFLIVTHTQPK
jgi:hypothetical protein